MDSYARSFEEDINSKPESAKYLVDFAFYSSIGDIDKACSVIQLNLQNMSGVWKNLAASCLKSYRFDIAIKALQSMGYSHSVLKMQSVINDPEYNKEAIAATLAGQLGKPFIKHAVHLYEKAGRWDLLNL